MSLELESWKSYVGNEKERLDCGKETSETSIVFIALFLEYQNKRKILEEEYEKKYEELQKGFETDDNNKFIMCLESDDLAKRKKKYELECEELSNEWERLISWKKNKELELEEREKGRKLNLAIVIDNFYIQKF